MLQTLGYLLFVVTCFGAASIAISIVRRQLQKAAAERRHRELLAQGYVVVEVPLSPQEMVADLRFGFSMTRPQYVHESAIAPFTAQRAVGLAECDRLMAAAWDRLVVGQVDSDTYIRNCQLYIASYRQIGDRLERQAVAKDFAPESVKAVRRAYYDYDFPDPRLEVLRAGASRGLIAGVDYPPQRDRWRNDRRERPMRDVTPQPPRIGSRRLH